LAFTPSGGAPPPGSEKTSKVSLSLTLGARAWVSREEGPPRPALTKAKGSDKRQRQRVKEYKKRGERADYAGGRKKGPP